MPNIADDISNAWDNGFVAGAFALAIEFDIDELDIAEFFSKKCHDIDFDKIDEPRRSWLMNFWNEHGLVNYEQK